MTTREELKDAFKRLDLVQEELFGVVLDDPIEILDKNERGSPLRGPQYR
jgi:hypothetical protein|nr:MAG TPA: hypothetical protein [Caudoviricetes sp.]